MIQWSNAAINVLKYDHASFHNWCLWFDLTPYSGDPYSIGFCNRRDGITLTIGGQQRFFNGAYGGFNPPDLTYRAQLVAQKFTITFAAHDDFDLIWKECVPDKTTCTAYVALYDGNREFVEAHRAAYGLLDEISNTRPAKDNEGMTIGAVREARFIAKNATDLILPLARVKNQDYQHTVDPDDDFYAYADLEGEVADPVGR